MTNKIAVIYHYFERDTTYKENLIFFLSVGIHDDANYYIIISGKCSVALPIYPNVTYIYTINKNNDFGGYIKFATDYFPNAYEKFIFVNSSVRGPFSPDYIDQNWTDIFVKKLRNNTHLIGASINILPESSPYSNKFSEIYCYSPPYNHVQTTAYALTSEAMQHLIEIGFYDVDRELTKEEVIIYYELRMSQEIIKNGWNFSTILPIYSDIDYQKKAPDYENFSARYGDTLYRGAFFGRTLSPTEALFVKVNRNMITHLDLASYTFTSLYKFNEKLNTFNEGKSLLEKSYLESKAILHSDNKISLKSILYYLIELCKKSGFVAQSRKKY